MLARRLLGAGGGSGQAPTYVARAWGDTGGSDAGSVTINKPAGTLQGHLMTAVVFGSRSSISPEVGWNYRGGVNGGAGGNAPAIAVFEKLAGASEPSSYVFAALGGIKKLGGEIQTWATARIEQVGTAYEGVGTNPIVMPGLTPAEAALLLAFVASNNSGVTYTTPSGMTSRAATNTNEPSLASFYQSAAKGAATGTRSSTPSTGAAHRGIMMTLVGV